MRPTWYQMSPNIIVRRADGVVHVTLNRPARKNAMLPAMWAELADIIVDVDNRDSDRVLVLGGEGGAFCTGADISGRGRISPTAGAAPSSEQVLGDIKRCVLALAHMTKPTVAAVDGIAAGGGCNLALACDLVVASDQARFSEIFVRRGLTVDSGGSWILPRLIGSARARRLILLGEVIDAGEAYQMGLVTHLVAAADLQAAVAGIAGQLSASPAVTLAADKRLLAQSETVTLAQALDLETASQLNMLDRPHVEAAAREFLARQDGSTTAESGNTTGGQQVS